MRKNLLLCLLGVSLGMAGCGGGGGGGDDGGGDPIDTGITMNGDGGPGTDGTVTTIDAGIPRGPVLTQLVSGEKLNCAVLQDGTGKCWGDNREGRFGNGNKTSNKVPQAISGLTAIKQISLGYDHACAAMVDGTARCWGKNTNGSLGDNSTMERLSPATVMGLTDVKTIHAGMWTSCALTNTGNVFCWGRGGNLGDTTLTDSLVPKQVTTLSNVSQLSVAFNSGRGSSTMQACGVRQNGTVFCWGGNDVGQLGQNNQNPSRIPVDVPGITDAIEVTTGGGHTCARRTGGLSCWGFGSYTGDGNNVQDLAPVAVTTPTTINAIAAGNDHTLARTTAGGLLCWGRGTQGQCMDSVAFTPSGPAYLAPTAVSPTGITLFAAGGTGSCVYVPTSSVTFCSGTNEYGEIGSGTPSSLFRSSTPSPVEW